MDYVLNKEHTVILCYLTKTRPVNKTEVELMKTYRSLKMEQPNLFQ